MLALLKRPRLGVSVLGKRMERQITDDCAVLKHDVTAPCAARISAKAKPHRGLCAGLLASADKAALNVAVDVLGEAS
jgi:hypothetical protein